MDAVGSGVSSSEKAEIEARIAKNKAEVEQLTKDLVDLHAEDFRAKFNMDITNLRKQITKDEETLKGLK